MYATLSHLTAKFADARVGREGGDLELDLVQAALQVLFTYCNLR